MLPLSVSIEEYLDDAGGSPFGRWFDTLEATAAAKVTVAVIRLGRGATSSIKGIGDGVVEYRIDSGPGYRIYLGRDGDQLIILLGGGTKRRQSADIEAAKSRWTNYKARKRAQAKGKV